MTKTPSKPTASADKAKPAEIPKSELAKLTTSPLVAGFRLLQATNSTHHWWAATDFGGICTDLRSQITAVNGGDLSHAEGMLITQAISLQSLFVNLTEKSMEQDQMSNIEGLMKLALRSQNQCRATLETLAAIKNPTTVFTKQANFSQGHQQINNGTTARVEKDIQPNELLSERQNYAAMDSGRESAAIGINTAMATVAA